MAILADQLATSQLYQLITDKLMSPEEISQICPCKHIFAQLMPTLITSDRFLVFLITEIWDSCVEIAK